uniref:Uncharacterized protein n=1 Tax=Lepeophtheirus salmonis TaxID=72036 RepID=A0A0K2TY05_LEPSM
MNPMEEEHVETEAQEDIHLERPSEDFSTKIRSQSHPNIQV